MLTQVFCCQFDTKFTKAFCHRRCPQGNIGFDVMCQCIQTGADGYFSGYCFQNHGVQKSCLGGCHHTADGTFCFAVRQNRGLAYFGACTCCCGDGKDGQRAYRNFICAFILCDGTGICCQNCCTFRYVNGRTPAKPQNCITVIIQQHRARILHTFDAGVWLYLREQHIFYTFLCQRCCYCIDDFRLHEKWVCCDQ